ncbi:MAG: U32 family peptidase, partial [Oscillospiraceae bacterium]|nr:U32 family peptidase [Oscillospiraceae bacterium]
MVTDGELDRLEAAADAVAAAGTDAVILQDFAALRLFREKYPSIRRHASTQCAVHNVAGVLAAREAGFDRVVAARELSLDEIRALTETGVEIEVFVHGALCMC